MYRHFFKRILDFIVSLVLCVIFSPLLVIISIIMYREHSMDPFFQQVRPGKNGKVFMLIKFRTMDTRKDSSGNLLPDNERFTKIGKFLRKTSLDELPQLFNVLKGDMSLIGPRPLLVEYIGRYNEIQNRRHEVLPGITGWAQVNGRNAISWNEKFKLDVWYVDHVNFLLDMRICFLTIRKVFKREGINSSSTITMEKFRGTND